MTSREKWATGFIAGCEQEQQQLRDDLAKSYKRRRILKVCLYAVLAWDVAWLVIYVATATWWPALLMLGLALYMVYLAWDDKKSHARHVAVMRAIDADYDRMIGWAQQYAKGER